MIDADDIFQHFHRRHCGHYVHVEPHDGRPLFVWKMPTEFIDFIVATPNVFHGFLEIVDFDAGEALVLISSIEDDALQPFKIQTILDRRLQRWWAFALECGPVDAVFLDPNTRILARAELEVSRSQANLDLLRKTHFAVPGTMSDQTAVIRNADWILEARKSRSHGIVFSLDLQPTALPASPTSPGEPIVGKTGEQPQRIQRTLQMKHEGTHLEYDVAKILCEVFPADWVHLGPHVSNAEEICDVLAVTPTDIFAVQCKKPLHKPAFSEADSNDNINRQIERIHHGITQVQNTFRSLQTQMVKVRFAKDADHVRRIEALRKVPDLPFEVGKKHFHISVAGKRQHFLIVAPDIYPEVYGKISQEIFEQGEAMGAPLLVWSLDTLQAAAHSSYDPETFLARFDVLANKCLEIGTLCKPYIDKPFINVG